MPVKNQASQGFGYHLVTIIFKNRGSVDTSAMEESYLKDLVDVFEDVKEAVRKSDGGSRAGLMLGLQEMGSSPEGFIGGYYTLYSNLIVMNKTLLERIVETDPTILRPYAFHVLLHEYIHSLGFFDEETARRKTYEISSSVYGECHIATEMARDMRPFFPNLVYPSFGWQPRDPGPVELVRGFDKTSYQGYIS
jgi:hypothetical protein